MTQSDFEFLASQSPDVIARKRGINLSSSIFNWWRAHDIIGAVDLDLIQFWNQFDGTTARRFRQDTSAFQPRFNVNVLNGYPTLTFQTGDYMQVDGGVGSGTNHTMIMIFRVISPTVDSAYTYFGGNAFAGQTSYVGASGTNFTYGTNNVVVNGSAVDGDWHVIGKRYSPSDHDGELDGAFDATGVVGFGNTNFNLGLNALNDGSVGNGRIEIAEYIFFKEQLELSEMDQIADYLAVKYGLVTQSTVFDFNTGSISGKRGVGRPELHANLTAPLPATDGYYLRSYENTDGTIEGDETYARALVTDADGYFTGIPQTDAISLRAWVRAEGLVADGYSQIALVAQGDGYSTYDKDHIRGYALKFGTIIDGDTYGGLGLRISTRDQEGLVDGYSDINCTGTFNEDTWYRIRLDVVPVGATEDRLTAFYSSGGITDSEAWVQCGSVTIPSTSTSYRDWTGQTKQGFYVVHVEHSGSSASTKYFIDRFDIRRKTL